MNFSKLTPIAKLAVHIVSFVAVAASSVFDDYKISGVAEWCLLATAVAQAVLVWWVPEMTTGVARHAKSAVSIVIAAAGVIPVLALDGFTAQDAWQVLSVCLAAVLTPVVVNRGYVRAKKLV